ncbi:kinase-like protein [Mytilinidion resinicola]|uniref:Kinase-like protein n=1 Tax=Mytilinidion resinicola TaxID=574789 RepID=A0A6A6Z8Y8_9PEZI|nr:kinase-like protein [Mytilinidion resinicola]KAF2817193.1 kinase-like protein [Mytilinidion resinicola]
MPCFSRTIEFKPKSYGETSLKKGTEPRKRWLSLVSRISQSKWHIKVAYYGTLQSDQSSAPFAKVRKRREDLQNLCVHIDFDYIQLLDDTVTELYITRDHNAATVQGQRLRLKTPLDTGNEYTATVDHLWVQIQEDPSRVRFPSFGSGGNIPIKDLSGIRKERELAPGVYEVHINGDEELYVYKEIGRPLYEPRDSKVLEQELRNLELFRGTEAVVQLIAAVISKNPYETTDGYEEDRPAVLRGIILEHHPNGTIQDALRSQKRKRPWGQWALQTAIALDLLHQRNVPNMDLKPANIVISKENNAVLIDISGIGGVTQEWLSPEMQDLDDPLSQPVEARIQNDIWALGKMFSMMAIVSGNDTENQLLRSIAMDATAQDPHLRLPLREIISKLSKEGILQNSLQSIASGSNPPSVRSSM